MAAEATISSQGESWERSKSAPPSITTPIHEATARGQSISAFGSGSCSGEAKALNRIMATSRVRPAAPSTQRGRARPSASRRVEKLSRMSRPPRMPTAAFHFASRRSRALPGSISLPVLRVIFGGHVAGTLQKICNSATL